MRTFGEIYARKDAENGSVWKITGEPHMILKVKRVFSKVFTGTPGVAELSNSPENCRDLLWFMERYPLEIADADMRAIKRGGKQYIEQLALIDDLISGKQEPKNFELAIPARPYQRVAAECVLKTRHLLLGDDVGVGKTASAICALTDKDTRPALVVTLAHITRQWFNEFGKFAPGLRCHVAKQGTPYKLADKNGDLPDVLIMNYHKLHGWADTIVKKNLARSVVFDEIQELRRVESNKYSAARLIAGSAKYKLGCSATPIFNFGDEMWNVLNILKAGALGSRDEFMREWCNSGGVKDPRAFGSYLREIGLFLRRTRKDVDRELPPITKIPYAIDSDQSALDGIQVDAEKLARTILSHERNGSFLAAGEFDAMMRHATGVAKAPFVADFVRLLVESGESVLLFGWHHDVYDIWRDKLNDLSPVFFTGEQSPGQKEAAKQAFANKTAKILIMSLRAGAGVDGLQHICRTVVFGELDWSPAVHEQTVGRIARDGQKDPVMAYFLISDSGSDPVMADVLGLKEQQLEGIRDPSAPFITRVDSVNDRIKVLAAEYLSRRGKQADVFPDLPEDEPF